jgi:hypothetical protein
MAVSRTIAACTKGAVHHYRTDNIIASLTMPVLMSANAMFS